MSGKSRGRYRSAPSPRDDGARRGGRIGGRRIPDETGRAGEAHETEFAYRNLTGLYPLFVAGQWLLFLLRRQKEGIKYSLCVDGKKKSD